MFLKSHRTYRIVNATQGAEYAAAVRAARETRANQFLDAAWRARHDVDATRQEIPRTRFRDVTNKRLRAEIGLD